VGLFGHVVAPGSGDHLLMIDLDEARELPNCGPVTPQLNCANRVWDIVFTQQPGEKRFRSVRIAVPLKQDIEYEAVLVHRSPKPVLNTIDSGADFIKKPAGTPAGFPLAQIFSEERSELHAPFAEGFMADHNAALVQ
jgi:hypothetical protein